MNSESVTIKITMPKVYADFFIQESKDYFADNRFLTILLKDKLLKAITENQSEDVRDMILRARKDIFMYLQRKRFWER